MMNWTVRCCLKMSMVAMCDGFVGVFLFMVGSLRKVV